MSTEQVNNENLEKKKAKKATNKKVSKKKASSKKAKTKKAEQKNVKSKEEIIEPKVMQSNLSSEKGLDKNLSDDFLSKQIESNKALTQKVWKWGGLGLLVLAIYLSAMISSIKKVVFDTEGIATIVANEIDNNMSLIHI